MSIEVAQSDCAVVADNEPSPQVPESFAVRDAASAAWVVRKIVEARAYAARVRSWAEAELRRAQREEQVFMVRFGRQLEEWTRQQIAQQHDGRKSVSLPSGVVGFRAEPAKLSVLDERRLLAWARAHLPSAIHVVETITKSAVTDHFKATGECPDGAQLVVVGERFYVSAKNFRIDEGEPHVTLETERRDATQQEDEGQKEC